MEETIIKDFVSRLLEDAQVAITDEKLLAQLRDSLEERVVTRLILELVQQLPHEAALRVGAAFEHTESDPEALFRKFGEEGLITAGIIVEILARLRGELVAELERSL